MENNQGHADCFLCKHPMMRLILVGLLIFLGAFCAFYTVADWHFKRMIDPLYQMQKFDREMIRQERKFDRVARKELRNQQNFERGSAQFIRVEKSQNFYRIIIDLRPFGNNEKNVDIKTDDNTVTISLADEKMTNRKQEVVRYSQTFSFEENIKSKNIMKVREGNNYIITIPF